jgi:cell division protein FtsQ
MKTGSKRGSGRGSERGSGTGTGVLDAPEPGYAPETTGRERGSGFGAGSGSGSGGTLQRPYSGYAGSGYGTDGGDFESFGDEADETPRRARKGGFRTKLRRLPKSVGGRILLGGSVLLVLGVAAVSVAGVRSYVLHDPLFVVATSADIQIVGNEHLSRADVLSVFGDDIERNVFRIPLGERRADLERLPWVAHATVMRLLPSHIRVLITERVPVAFVRQGTQIGLVDASGVLLDMPPEAAGDPSYSFPVLTGVSAGDPLSTRAARMEIYRRFMSDLDGTGEKFSQTLSEVDVSNPEDVKALVTSGGSDILVHFGEQQFLHRYEEFEQHLPEWKQQYPKLASADMRYDGQIVLEMQKGEGVPAGGGGGGAVGDSTATTKATEVSSAAPRSDSHESNSKDPRKSPTGMTTKKVTAKDKGAPVKTAAVKAAAVKRGGVKAGGVKAGGVKAAAAKTAPAKTRGKTNASAAGEPQAFWVKKNAARAASGTTP